MLSKPRNLSLKIIDENPGMAEGPRTLNESNCILISPEQRKRPFPEFMILKSREEGNQKLQTGILGVLMLVFYKNVLYRVVW